MPTVELYLAVLPLVHISDMPYTAFGTTEQTITLFPSRAFATEFFKDEVDGYINTFRLRAEKYLVGGHSKGFEFHKEDTDDGRVIVRVTQNVG
jgi:hypothetical protein